jgi:hypothetical protein
VQLVWLSRRTAAGLSPALQGGGGVPQVTVVGASVERGGGPPGRTSTTRMTLWRPDLEVGAASQPDLAGGGGGGGGGGALVGTALLGTGWRPVASCGGMVGGHSSPLASVVSLVSGGLLDGVACHVSSGGAVHRRLWTGSGRRWTSLWQDVGRHGDL